MKTVAQKSSLVSFGSWLRKTKATLRREAIRALELHFEYCAMLAESRRRK